MRRIFHLRPFLSAWSVSLACLGFGVVLGASQAIIACEFTVGEKQAATWSGSASVNEGVEACVDESDLIVADLDEDDSIGVDDLLILLAEFGTISDSKADINNDRIVDSADLIEILSRLNLDN